MSTTVANIPFLQAEFDKNGLLMKADPIPPGTTDLFVISHGWRNDAAQARDLYKDLFTHFGDPAVVNPAKLAGRKCAILGLYWPSRNFDALIAAQGGDKPTNAAAFGTTKSDAASQLALVNRLEDLKRPGLFDEPDQIATLSEVQGLVKTLDDNRTSRVAFVKKLRGLLDPHGANKEDASDIFLRQDEEDIFKRLNIAAVNVDPSIPRTGNALSFSPGSGPAQVQGKAVGLLDIFKGATAAGSNVVSFFSYYLMKQRAGLVGEKGLAPLLDKIAPEVKRIHLIGHSFGGRVIASAALNSKTDKIQSACFLQAAFSHNGFSPATQMNGFFRAVIDQQRIKGPIIATHTKNDSAVGLAYPLASRLSGAVAASLGDENDRFGGLGRNGAQKMNPGEVIKGELLPVGGTYTFTPQKIYNLLGDAFIPDHSGITGPQVAAAVAAASL